MTPLVDMARRARDAARVLCVTSTVQRREALHAMADCVLEDSRYILEQNAPDIADARANNEKEFFIERMTLSDERLRAIADAIRETAALPDPLNMVLDGSTRPNGLRIRRVRVPLGVVGVIYESRPNVTADTAALCVYSGNACILRGGKEALRSNIAIMAALRRGLERAGLPADAAAVVEDPSRETAQALMKLNGMLDVLIPRGGAGLIRAVVENATVPVIETGTGNCHVYVDRAADMDMARRIAVSAKISRPSVCNAAETLLVDAAIADAFLPGCLDELSAKGVEVRGCSKTMAYRDYVKPACEDDWYAEYLELIYAVKVVDGVDAAIAHINAYGTRHSEAIVTGDLRAAHAFEQMVDAAAVYVNASTRFTDGAEFGLGAEVGISNQKLHARGPMGLSELTTYKYLISGEGQTR